MSAAVVDVVGKKKKVFALDHHIFSNDRRWLKRRSDPAPNLILQLSVHKEDYRELGLPQPTLRETIVGGNCDSGADSKLLKHFHACGFKKVDLYPVVS